MKKFLRLALIIGTLPNQLTNGTTADATQVMADLNKIVNDVNANAAPLATAVLTNVANVYTAVQYGIAATGDAAFPIASQVQQGLFNNLTSTTGTNSITARVPAYPLAQYVVGETFTFTPSTLPTSPFVTLSIDGLSAIPLAVMGSTSIGMVMGSGAPTQVQYDGSRFNILNPQPGLVLLDSQTANLSSTIELGRNITSQFDEYQVKMSGVRPVTQGAGLRLFMIAGSTFPIGSYRNTYMGNSDGGVPFGGGTQNTTFGELSGPNGIDAASAGWGFSGTLSAFGLSQVPRVKMASGDFVVGNGLGPGSQTKLQFGLYVSAAFTPITALRFQMNSSQISGGSFTLYGVRKQ